jgi:hypothetical protein
VSKAYKGSILLRSVVSVSSCAVEAKASWINFFDRNAPDREGKTEFTLHTADRSWIFQCESAKCSAWCAHINKYVGGSNSADASGGGSTGYSSNKNAAGDDDGEAAGDDSDLDE